MKNTISILVLVLIFSSCAKNEKIKLEKSDEYASYFPSLIHHYGSSESENPNLYSYEQPVDGVSHLESYLFSQGAYPSYHNYENIQYKRESVNEYFHNVTFYISEQHKNIYINGYVYDVNLTRFELPLIKFGQELHNKWSSTETVSFSYKKDGFSSPNIPITDKEITFDFEVVNIKDQRVYNEITYTNVITIKVDYTIDNVAYYRTYSFSRAVGLIHYSINGKEITINS